MDNIITGNSSSFYCGPDTIIKYQKVQKHVYVMYSFLNFATALRPLMLFYQPLGTLT